jgi:anti-anti-sigma factor
MQRIQLVVPEFVPQPLAIDTVADPAGTIRVRVSGEVDLATVDPLVEALSAAVAQRPDLVEVDLADVPFMDSTGVNALVRAHHAAAKAGCRLRVVRPHRLVHRVLQTCGLLATLGL